MYRLDSVYLSAIEAMGISLERVLKKSAIPVKPVIKDGIALTQEQYMAFMNHLDGLVTDDALIQFTDMDHLALFVPPIFAGLCSKDGMGCFKRISKYKQLMGPCTLQMTVTEKEVALTFLLIENELTMPRVMLFAEQLIMLNLIRKGTGKNIVPVLVSSQYSYGSSLVEYFQVEPVFGEKNQLIFTREDASEPFLTENNVMWQYLEPELNKRIAALEEVPTFAAKVRSTLFEQIPSGEACIEETAAQLAMSSRTLQRKLKEEGTSFIQELNETRVIMARNYLKDNHLNNDEIAFLVGYSDVNAFQRAFRKWTGMTLGSYRKSIIA